MLRSPIGLRVALVTDLYPPSIGGQQTRFEALATALTGLGDSVTVICTQHEPAQPRMERRGGVEIVRMPLLPRYERPWIRQLQRSPVGMVRFAARSRALLRQGSFDVAYFNQWPYLHVLVAPLALRRAGGIDWCEYRSGVLHRTFEWYLPRMVGFNFSVNTWVARKIESASGCHVGYLPTGVNSDVVEVDNESPRRGILFLGRLTPNKNLSLLIDSYVVFRSLGFDDDLIIAGTGPEVGLLKRLVAALHPDLGSSVHLLGEIDDAEKHSLLRASRVLALPSLREGFPNVVAEAAAFALPVATTASPLNGTSTVVRDYGIGVVGPSTPLGFADTIASVASRHREFAEPCRRMARELNWSRLARLLHDELVAVSGRTRPIDSGAEGTLA